jgi:hypothetical protein
VAKLCFVIQKFDRGRYDQLFEQIFDPAIRKADLEPYRVDRDPGASIPIDTIEEKISTSAACLVEMSEDNPNVWYELGFARARGKPLCLVCAESRQHFPFDIQHRKIITYPQSALPNDFDALKASITARLVAEVSKAASFQQNADAAKSMLIAPKSDGLRPHELLALTIIFQYHYEGGVGVYQLVRDMEKGGFTKPATSLALTGLKRKLLVETREARDSNGDFWEPWFVTDRGEEWLLDNQHRLNLGLPDENEPSISGPEISDEDIPF